jgi:tetratricopeptide (TPR) repeat protein
VTKVFLNYRRNDSSGYVGRLTERLHARFGSDAVFRDLDSIAVGRDFRVAIQEAIAVCDAVVAVIGRHWLDAVGRDGTRRLDDPDDSVRVELATALEREVLLIPVLVDGATMPAAVDLPPPLAPLAYRNALEISEIRWEYDVSRLINVLDPFSAATLSGAVSGVASIAAGGDTSIGQGAVQTAERPWRAPAQLPRDIDDFTGRGDLLDECQAVLDRDPAMAGESTAAPVLAVYGKPGVGKTTFAVRLAHRLARRFPDGQLFVSLRGVEAERLDPAVVLADFLDAVGVPPASVPAELDARAALYRDRLAGRRVLVVLDNAAEEAQVRPLLPGAPECAAVVTSRQPLHGLDVTRLLALDVFDEGQAVDLLAGAVGPERVAAEPGRLAEIAGLCGYLPLALRIVGAKLAAKRHWSLERMARRLSDERDRLDELQGGDREVRASFELSYAGLDPVEGRAFRLLGLLTARSFPAWPIAVLLDDPDVDAEELAESLVDAQLLELEGVDETGEPRYRFHDLLRLFARERVDAEEPEPARQAAVTRVVDAYLSLAQTAQRAVNRIEVKEDATDVAGGTEPPVPVGWAHGRALQEKPLAWMRAEKLNVVAAAVQARDAGLYRQAWQLSRTLNTFFIWHAHWDESLHVKQVALDAAQRAGDRGAEALVLLDLGGASLVRNDWTQSIEHLTRSRALFREVGDESQEIETVLHLGVTYRDYARYDAAVACFQEVLPQFRRLGNELLEASTYQNLGAALREQGDVDGAMECFERALPVFERLDDHIARARTLHSIGVARRYLGQHEEAAPHFELSLQLCRQVGDLRWEGILLLSIGRLQRHEGQLGEAMASAQQALPLFLRLGDLQGEAHTYRSMGAVLRDRDDLEGSAAYLDRAHELMAGLKHERGMGQMRHAIGATQIRRGALDEAVDSFEASTKLFAALGDRPWQLRSLGRLSLARLARGDHAGAFEAVGSAKEVLAGSPLPAASPLRAWVERLPTGESGR